MKISKITETKGLTLTIDPGITGTGLALWRNSEWGKLTYPIWCDNIVPYPTRGNWNTRAKDLTKKLREEVGRINSDKNIRLVYEKHLFNAIIEEPKYFADSAYGDMTAKTNSLGKLYMLVGLLMGVLWENGVEVELVRVDRWKGNCGKEIIINRIRKRLPDIDKRLSPKTHSFDAIGIGLHAKGFLTIDRNHQILAKSKKEKGLLGVESS